MDCGVPFRYENGKFTELTGMDEEALRTSSYYEDEKNNAVENFDIDKALSEMVKP